VENGIRKFGEIFGGEEKGREGGKKHRFRHCNHTGEKEIIHHPLTDKGQEKFLSEGKRKVTDSWESREGLQYLLREGDTRLPPRSLVKGGKQEIQHNSGARKERRGRYYCLDVGKN